MCGTKFKQFVLVRIQGELPVLAPVVLQSTQLHVPVCSKQDPMSEKCSHGTCAR